LSASSDESMRFWTIRKKRRLKKPFGIAFTAYLRWISI